MKSTKAATKVLLDTYYKAFNRQDTDLFISLLADDVIHDVNQGLREIGKPAFLRFFEQMNIHYREHIFDVETMINEDGSRAATEYERVEAELADVLGDDDGRVWCARLLVPGGAGKPGGERDRHHRAQ
jgi:ketosteroid isomerase-like protein